ncbi:cation transporter [candidate division WOR-3 bacterium]|nr:cation transporter [candidate division WOR-3 bacterium]
METENKQGTPISEECRAKKASAVTLFSFVGNLVLTFFKLFSGIIGHSGAMVADAVHSLSDFATDLVILISFRIVKKPRDKTHDYGHGKFETLATAIIGVTLFWVAAGILISGGRNAYIILIKNETVQGPTALALVATIVSILVKEIIYRYTVSVGREIESMAVIANAWHHRSDVFSSLGTFLGIGGAYFLGDKWVVLDPLAAIGVSIFMFKLSFVIIYKSVRELMEESLGDETKKQILDLIKKTEGVFDPHDLKTRKIGDKIAIDVHIRVPNDMTIVEAHKINDSIEFKIREKFGENTIIYIHTEPEEEQIT